MQVIQSSTFTYLFQAKVSQQRSRRRHKDHKGLFQEIIYIFGVIKYCKVQAVFTGDFDR